MSTYYMKVMCAARSVGRRSDRHLVPHAPIRVDEFGIIEQPDGSLQVLPRWIAAGLADDLPLGSRDDERAAMLDDTVAFRRRHTFICPTCGFKIDAREENLFECLLKLHAEGESHVDLRALKTRLTES